jgi:uncharacterized protein with GYD domain
MPKYMFRASYTAKGAEGLLKEGGTKRTDALNKLVGSVGGKVESMYWAFGADDVYLTADLPDASAAAAVSLSVGAGGGASVTTSELLTAQQVDEVVRRKTDYRPPGK